MQVQGPGGVKGTDKTKKKSGAKAADGSFSDFIASGTQQKAAASPTTSIVQVDALLALQGADDPTARAAKQRMRQRANDILDGLDDIRDAMLSGRLTVGHIVDIADVVATHREKISDPKLMAIMDEIDLRAQVELAKVSVAMNKRA